MPKLNKQTLKKLIAEEYSKLHELMDVDPQKIKAQGKLSVELSVLAKCVKAFNEKMAQDPDMEPVKNDPELKDLLEKLMSKISVMSDSAGKFVKVSEKPVAKPVVTKQPIKPAVKVV